MKAPREDQSQKIDVVSPPLEHMDSGLLKKMMTPHVSPMPRSRLAQLYPISLRFKKKSLETKFSTDNDQQRFYTSQVYTLVVYTLIFAFFMIATPKYMDYHSVTDWPVYMRMVAFAFVCLYILLSILGILYFRCKYGRKYKQFVGIPFGRYWELIIALMTTFFMTIMCVTMGAIMESKIFWVLSHCKTHDLRDIITFPLSCGDKAPDVKVEYEELFTNWELKTSHGASFILSTSLLVSIQQLDWMYCASVVIWIYFVLCAVHVLKAPKQDFSFYYGEMPCLESLEDWLGIVSFHTAVVLFGLTMLYQVASLRRRQYVSFPLSLMKRVAYEIVSLSYITRILQKLKFEHRYASLIAIDRIRRLEKAVAMHQIGKQKQKIGELEESWRVSADEITCDALLATGGSGEVWRGRMHRQNEEERIVAIKKCVMGFDQDFYHDDRTSSKGSLWEDGEIKLLMLVRHERLVSFMGAGEMNGYRFLVVELMTGGSIEKKLWGKVLCCLISFTFIIFTPSLKIQVHHKIRSRNILDCCGHMMLRWVWTLYIRKISYIVI